MDETPIYQQIAESIRQEILYGHLPPGALLPTVRDLAQKWSCTPGTVQRAFRELGRQGVITSQRGRRSQVAALPAGSDSKLRLAELVHRADAFLLATLTAGYSPEEIETATRLALDRWRGLIQPHTHAPNRVLRFAGSHDLALSEIAAHFFEIADGYQLQTVFSGSLGGLIALSRGEADIAGSHLWEESDDSYNLAAVRRLMPGRNMALITLAHRRLGLITLPGNPRQVRGLADLAGLRFVNRQRGAGTRVWLDAQLRRLGLSPDQIAGFDVEVLTHADVAHYVATGQADAGLGIEAAALAYSLDFVALTTERYELIMNADALEHPAVRALVEWLGTEEARATIAGRGGYVTDVTGEVRFLN